MADQPFTGGIVNAGVALPEKAVDMGDGTYARRVAAVSVSSAGAVQDGLPAGRAAPGASVPVAPDTVALAGINQTYTRAAAVGATAGNAVLVTGVTTAGTVTLTLSGGGTVTINAPLGSSIWPFAATAAALGTAVGGTFQSLFFV